MRHPSLFSLFDGALVTLKRFPLPLIAGFIVTVCLILYVECEEQFIFARLALGGGLAFSLLILVKLLAEFREVSLRRNLSISVITGLALAGYGFYYTPADPDLVTPVFWYRTTLLLMAIHLGIALSPLLAKSADQRFWPFNLKLFLQFFHSSINAALLFTGLALALVSIEKLFGLPIREDLYGHIWIVCAFLIHPLLFLTNIPNHKDELRADSYPRALRFTLQFITLPLCGAYLLILYAYLAKILFQWSWPNGWVAMPIFIFALLNVLTYTLSKPLSGQNGWARLYHAWNFRLLLPLSIILFMAMQIRLQDYGMTINRYLGLILAVWLFVISLAHVLRPRLHLAWIPSSLLVVCLFALYSGPFSVFEWSERAQLQRVHLLANQFQMLDNGVLRPLEKSQDPEIAKQLSSSLSYLIKNFGEQSLKTELSALYESPEGDNFKNARAWRKKDVLINFLNLQNSENKFRLNGPEPSLGFAYRLCTFYLSDSGSRKIKTRRGKISIEFSQEKQTIEIYLDEQKHSSVNLAPWVPVLLKASSSENKEAAFFKIQSEVPHWEFGIAVNNGAIESHSKTIRFLGGALYCNWPEEPAD